MFCMRANLRRSTFVHDQLVYAMTQKRSGSLIKGFYRYDAEYIPHFYPPLLFFLWPIIVLSSSVYKAIASDANQLLKDFSIYVLAFYYKQFCLC